MKLGNSGEGWNTHRRRLAAELTSAVLRAERRLGRSLDRQQLAKRLNVSPASLYAYLNGSTLPRSATLERLLDELGVAGAERGQLTTLRDAAEVMHRVGRHTRANLSVPPRPHQLPPETRHFVGRANELARLTEIASAPDAGARLCVIEGTAGVGKTTLAIRVGHKVKNLFPDGHLYADLHGFAATPPVETAEALLGFLQALGAPPSAIPTTLAARTALYRSLLHDQRVLVVLDNASSSDQVRPLIPPAPGCLLLVSSRNRMHSLIAREGAVRIPLATLEPRDAVRLLDVRIGAERVAADPDALRDLTDLCAGLPLALSVAASRAAERPEEPLAALVAELRDTGCRLDPLSSSDLDMDLRTVFRWSYDKLTSQAARLFRLLGLHPGPDTGLAACAALAGTHQPPRRALRELVSANLLTEQPGGRFRLHDLLHAYARERTIDDDLDTDRAAAQLRILDHYLDAASAANARIQPKDAEERGDVSPVSGTYADAMAWFTTEHEVLLALTSHAANHGFEPHAWRLAWACMVFLRRSGRHATRIDMQRIAVSAARRVGDRAALATSCRMLADALARGRQGAKVQSLLTEALAAFECLGDNNGALRTHLSFVRALDAEGAHARALEHAEAALCLAETVSDQPMLADALAATARQLTRLNHTAAALDRCARAMELYAAVGNSEGNASVLKIIGDAELHCGNPERAITAYQRSLTLDQALGDRYWEAHALSRLAAAHRALGDPSTADRLQAEARTTLEVLHHPDAAKLRK